MWVEPAKEGIQLCGDGSAGVSWEWRGGPEWWSRCLLCRSSEAHLEAPLGQGVEGGAAQPTVEEESDHGAPQVTERDFALPQRRKGGAQDH